MAGGKAKANLEAAWVEEAMQRLVDMVMELRQYGRGLTAECLQHDTWQFLGSGCHCGVKKLLMNNSIVDEVFLCHSFWL